MNNLMAHFFSVLIIVCLYECRNWISFRPLHSFSRLARGSVSTKSVQLIWMKTKLSTFLSMFIFCHRVFHSMLSIMHKTASTPADLYQGHTNVMYFVVYSTCYQFLPQQNQSIRLQVYVNLLQRCHIYIVSFIVVFSLAKMIRLFPEICDAVVLQIFI